jgi:hypothetical protein
VEGRYKATEKREIMHPYDEAGLLNYLGDEADLGYLVVNEELCLFEDIL